MTVEQVELHPRWGTVTPLEEVQERAAQADGLIHAAARASDPTTMCEVDGPELTGSPNYVRLNLNTPGSADLRHTVTCPSCVAWMHA